MHHNLYKIAIELGSFSDLAELIVQINEKQGVYFVLAFLLDNEYSKEDIAKLMHELIKQEGAVTPEIHKAMKLRKEAMH